MNGKKRLGVGGGWCCMDDIRGVLRGMAKCWGS